MLSVAQRNHKHEENYSHRNRNRSRNLGRRAAQQQHSHQRQVNRHGQILEDQHGENGRSLGVIDAAQLLQYLGYHPGGGDVSNAAEQDRRQRTPTQKEPGRQSRGEVQDEVHHAGREPGTEVVLQLGSAALQPQHEKEQEDANLRAGADEVPT